MHTKQIPSARVIVESDNSQLKHLVALALAVLTTKQELGGVGIQGMTPEGTLIDQSFAEQALEAALVPFQLPHGKKGDHAFEVNFVIDGDESFKRGVENYASIQTKIDQHKKEIELLERVRDHPLPVKEIIDWRTTSSAQEAYDDLFIAQARPEKYNLSAVEYAAFMDAFKAQKVAWLFKEEGGDPDATMYTLHDDVSVDPTTLKIDDYVQPLNPEKFEELQVASAAALDAKKKLREETAAVAIYVEAGVDDKSEVAQNYDVTVWQLQQLIRAVDLNKVLSFEVQEDRYALVSSVEYEGDITQAKFDDLIKVTEGLVIA